MTPNRVVALITPFAAPVAGAFAAWLSQQAPGINVAPEAVEEVFIAVTALVVGLALQFNHNRYKWDAMKEESAAAADAGLGGVGSLEEAPLVGVGVDEEAADLEEPDPLIDEDEVDDDDIGADDDILDQDELELEDEADELGDDLLEEDEDEEDEEELLGADTDRIVHGSAGVEELPPSPPARATT